jgi:hypothetical protein
LPVSVIRLEIATFTGANMFRHACVGRTSRQSSRYRTHASGDLVSAPRTPPIVIFLDDWTYFGVTRNNPPELLSSSIQSAPSGPTSTSRMRWPTSQRAGVGWEPGIVGKATVGADLESPAGFALQTGQPVISIHLENEQRFRTPELLVRHGIHRAINVILQGDGRPFGVLEVDSRSEDEFTAHDLAFLQGAANVLGMAIERERQDRSLQAALAHQEVLFKEMTHRVKNSLAIVEAPRDVPIATGSR